MPFKTQAFVLDKVDAPFTLKTIELDDPLDTEVLVEIVACGLCHTDLLVANGAFPSAFPATVGHEGAGRVIKIGKAVTRVQEGDSVLLSFSYCEKCKTCKAGHPSACTTWTERNFGRIRDTATLDGQRMDTNASLDGQRIHGTFFGQSALAKHALVVESSLTKVPSDVDLVQLSPLGCGMQTGAGAVFNALKPEDPQNSAIAVFGAGAVGMAAIFAAAAINMKIIIAVDLQDSRLQLAESLGATHTINGKSDVLAKIKEICDGPCDFSVDATGAAPCIKAAWDCLGPRGAMAQIGTPGPGPVASLGIHEAVCLSKTYQGICEGDSNPPVFIPRLLELYKAGRFPVDKISMVFPHTQINDAIHAVHDGSVIKPIISFQ